MKSLLDKLLGAVATRESIRGMGNTILAATSVVASSLGHGESDVEHAVRVLLDLSDVSRALAARGVHRDDVHAVVEQLLDERHASDVTTTPTRSPRLAAVAELAAKNGTSASGVIRAIAIGLPTELVFLRKPLERVADDVSPLFDGAIAAKNGALSFDAWDEELRMCLGTMQKTIDKRNGWWLTPGFLLVAVIVLPRVTASLKARGIDPKALLQELNATRTKAPVVREPPAGHVPAVGPALFAVLLRAEQRAADDASDVRLRHVLAALREEPRLAPIVEQLVASL